MTDTSILANLNPGQRQAVEAPDGPVLVLAGPGSGKTRVLTRRIAYLIQQRGVPPYRIMAVTFTNKAAREMRERVEGVLGERVSDLTLGTFHSVCARWLRIEAARGDALPIGPDFTIYDSGDQLSVMKEVVRHDLGLDDKVHRPQRLHAAISNLKNDMITPSGFVPKTYHDEITLRAYEAYQVRLASANAVDFDDLLLMTAQMLRTNREIRVRYQQKYQHLLIDEFQDTNATQYELVHLIAGEDNSLFCVGDEDQSIYRWRGADYRNIQRLHEDYPAIITVLLEQNYRSTQSILDAATAVINQNQHRTPKALFTENGEGVPLVLYEAHSEAFEGEYVVQTIAELVASEGIEPGEVAVMYRTNAQSRPLEDAFIRASLPYRLVGATRFYGRKEIRDLIAYLRLVHNPDDTVSLMRVINTPTRGIGNKTINDLISWADQLDGSPGAALAQLIDTPDLAPFSGRSKSALSAFAEMLTGWRAIRERATTRDLLEIVIDEIRYIDSINDGSEQAADRIENINELVNLASEYDELPLTTFLEEVSLVADVDTLADDVNAPTLLTYHASKGLEFDVVFLVGLEETILPHQRSLEGGPEELEEERRLFYVGLTRARERVYLVYTFARTMWGDRQINLPSRFLTDIPKDLVESAAGQTYGINARRPMTWRQAAGPARPPRAGEGGKPTLKTGLHVRHASFGEGIIIEVKPSGSDQEIAVAFEDAGLKRLLASFANLEVLEK